MKIIEAVIKPGDAPMVLNVGRNHGALDQWLMTSPIDSERQVVRLLVDDDHRQEILDALQSIISNTPHGRIVVIPVEATMPRPTKKDEKGAEEKSAGVGATREELYQNVSKNAMLDSNFILLVLLSTIVATIGLIENNVAVIIGAMVIAPLLGPNIALALAAALGDTELMLQSLKTNLAGLGLAFVMSAIIGLLWPPELNQELLARTDVGLDSVALALASGAAAVLSLTTGLSSVLVGVMVAVALLPPTATLGLMLGGGHMDQAIGAALLLAINIASVNLAAKIVLLIRGVKPRTWLEKQKARQSMTAYLIVWGITLIVLMVAIYLRARLTTPA